ncbi:Hint domain-containing protein [Seohaeicola saemankumensis]|nr:Hint domain-containing protein [Seohaeicola saemankumensis]MCA0870133.1 Hint domain-containing protein [Seohaeicola saemankumensis]
MGDYAYASMSVYLSNGANLGSSSTAGVITDDDNDDLFDPGDVGPTTPGPFPAGTVYYGTIQINGVTYPVFQTPDAFQDLLVVSTTNDPLPSNIDPNTISVGDTYAMCFAAGTLIQTPGGARVIEDLKTGDLIETSDGRRVPVRWIGRQTVLPAFNPAARLGLVRIAAGALGDAVPHTDLTVTKDHAMLVDGVLCNAGALINGTTIRALTASETGQSYTVYHIETEAHEIILANGAPAETFIDNVSRRVFDNFAEFEAMYGDVPEMEELPLPRAMSARQLPSHVAARLKRKQAA